MLRLVLLCAATSLLTMSCQHPRSATPDPLPALEKMDVVLRSVLSDAPADSTLRVTLRVQQPWTDADRDELEATGLTLGTVAGDVITALGLPSHIRAAAALSSVVRLEGSRPVRRR